MGGIPPSPPGLLACRRRLWAVSRLRTLLWCRVSGRLHVPIVGPTGQSDWSVRLVGPTIVSCKRFVRPVGQTVGRRCEQKSTRCRAEVTTPLDVRDGPAQLCQILSMACCPCGLRGCKNRPAPFLAGCRTRRLNQALSVLSLSLGFL